jgi:hypothetical protein
MDDQNEMGCLGALIMLPFAAISLLVIYGITMLVFRFAFGVELPNPIDWLPESWREHIPRTMPHSS